MFDKAREKYERAYATSKAAGYVLGMDEARRYATYVAWFMGAFDVALSYSEESLALSRQPGNRPFEKLGLQAIALTQVYRGQFPLAIAALHEAAAIDMSLFTEENQVFLALAHIHIGEYQTGRELVRELVSAEEWWGDRWACRVLGWVALAEGDHPEALAYSQRSVELRRVLVGQVGREWGAWSQAPLGLALHGLGRRTEGQRQLCEALETCVEIRAFLPLMHLMPIIPVLLANDDGARLKERAVELYALASSLPFVANSRLFEDIAGKRVAAAAATLAPDVVEAAQARGRARDWWETAKEMLRELRELGWGDPLAPPKPQPAPHLPD